MTLSLFNISAERSRIFGLAFFIALTFLVALAFFVALTFAAVFARVGVVATVPNTSDWRRYPESYGISRHQEAICHRRSLRS